MSNRATAGTPARPTAAAPRAGSSTPRTTTPRTTPRTATKDATAPRPTAARTAAPRPDLRIVPGTAPARPGRRVARGLRNRRAPFVLLVVALLVGTTLGLLILNTAIAVDSLDATRLRTENAQRAQEVQRLERQVVSGSTPAEIARAAVAAGLVPAGPAAYLVIEAEGGSVLRGTPEPAEGGAEGGAEDSADAGNSDETTADETSADEEAADQTVVDEDAADETAVDEDAADETGDGDGD